MLLVISVLLMLRTDLNIDIDVVAACPAAPTLIRRALQSSGLPHADHRGPKA
jgi:hypothetical protein